MNNIPWPRMGDSLFKKHPNRKMDASLTFQYDKEYLYSQGYMEASEILAKAVVEKTEFGYPDHFVYPILFLFHHHLELKLKHIIRIYYKSENIQRGVPHTHDIVQLWNEGKAFIQKVNDGVEDDTLEAVDSIIRDLETLNRSSEGYRFAFGRNGESITEKRTINIENLSGLIPRINSFFDGVRMQMDNIEEFMDENRGEQDRESY
jgi:hypothetical protein